MEFAAALATLVALDLLRRTGRDVIRKVDVAVLGADALLHPSERLPMRCLARVTIVHEGGLAVGPRWSQPVERISGKSARSKPTLCASHP